jgi:electron transfer flavoprotein beta subunit
VHQARPGHGSEVRDRQGRRERGRGRLKYDVNDFDLWAVEAALQLAEKNPGSQTTAVTVGPDAAAEQLRKALSMGIDQAVLLKADKLPADGFAIAEALAAELKGGAYDVIFFGKKAIDSGAETVGIMVAELLDLPCVPGVFKLDIQGNKGTAMRALEGRPRCSSSRSPP